MKVPAARIEFAVSKRSIRPDLEHVFYDKEHERLIATDNKIAAVVPLATDPIAHMPDASTGLIPVEAIKAVRKAKGADHLIANGHVQLPDGRTFARPNEAMPSLHRDIDRHIPSVDESRPYIWINADLLYRLAKAITDPKTLRCCIRVYLPADTNSPIRVEGGRDTA